MAPTSGAPDSGHSLELGDFTLVNLARAPLGHVQVNPTFHLAMACALIACQFLVFPLADEPARLLFCCSSTGPEADFLWFPAAPEPIA